MLDWHTHIETALARERATGRMTRMEAEELQRRFGRLAVAMTLRGLQGEAPKPAAAHWMLHIQTAQNGLPPNAPRGKQARASRWWTLGSSAGLLRQSEQGIAFADAVLQEAFCLHFFVAHPLDARFLRLSARPAFRDIWRRWAEADQTLLEKLLALFTQGPDPKARARVARVLGYLCDQRAVPALLAASADSSGSVRMRAAQALVALGNSSAIEPLIRNLLAAPNDLRPMLTTAIGQVGEPAVQPLIELLKHADSLVQRAAIIGLGYTKSHQALQALLLHPIPGRYDTVTSDHLIDALARLGRAVPTLLIDAASDDEPEVRQRACQALGRLDQVDAALAEPLLALLKHLRAQDSKVRPWYVSHALINQITPQNVAIYHQMLEDADAEVRLAGAQALSLLGDKRAVEPLLALLHEHDHLIPRQAAETLGKLGDTRAVVPLIRMLADQTWGERSVAAKMQAALGPKRGEAFTGFVSARVRESAAKALGALGDRRAVAPLIEALTDPDASMRWSAADALGKLGDPQAIEPIKQALSDKEHGVRYHAADALCILAGESVSTLFLGVLQEMGVNTPDVVISALGRLGDTRSVEPLIALLNEPEIKEAGYWGEHVEMKRALIRALGSLRDQRAVEPLLELLPPATSDRGTLLRYPSDSVISALAEIGGPRALEALIGLLNSPHPAYTYATARALSEIADPRVLAALQQAHQRHPEDTVIARALRRVSSQINPRRAG